MTAKELYEKETGNTCPSNQIAYSEWYNEYVRWLEKKVVTQNDLIAKFYLRQNNYNRE